MHHYETGTDESFISNKKYIEASAEFTESNNEVLSRYVEILLAINRRYVGIIEIRWPTVPHPLYFRAGSSDLSNFLQIFRGNEYAFDVLSSPSRILDLGGYVGFAAVFLALRFPDALIISIEPSSANFRINTMNTICYNNISNLNVAVWGSSANLSVSQ